MRGCSAFIIQPCALALSSPGRVPRILRIRMKRSPWEPTKDAQNVTPRNYGGRQIIIHASMAASRVASVGLENNSVETMYSWNDVALILRTFSMSRNAPLHSISIHWLWICCSHNIETEYLYIQAYVESDITEVVHRDHSEGDRIVDRVAIMKSAAGMDEWWVKEETAM